MKEINVHGNIIKIVCDNEEEAKLFAPALLVILLKKPKINLRPFPYGKPK